MWVLALAGSALCLSCARTEPFAAKQTPAANPPRATPRHVLPISEPKEILDDFVYPPHVTRQMFVWRGTEPGEWQFNPPADGYGYAGFVFRYPCDFSNRLESTALQFQMKPRAAAKYLGIALVDGDRTVPFVMVDRPLADHEIGTWAGGWGVFAIPLTAFASKGPGVSRDGAGTLGDDRPMDWTDLREIRLFTLGNKTPIQEVTLRNLEIGPLPLRMRLQHAAGTSHEPWP